MKLPSKVKLVDVGPRDGLQNEKGAVPAAVKIELVHRLQDAGLTEIEVTSFVSPKWVPQMADAAEVMAGIHRKPGVRYSVLTPNLKGFEAAVLSKPDEIVVFAAASEAFSQRNINCSIAESIERFRPVVAAAREKNIYVRGAISCAVGCPYEGEVATERVELVARLLKEIGVQHVGVADTIGVGTPVKVQRAMDAALKHYDINDFDFGRKFHEAPSIDIVIANRRPVLNQAGAAEPALPGRRRSGHLGGQGVTRRERPWGQHQYPFFTSTLPARLAIGVSFDNALIFSAICRTPSPRNVRADMCGVTRIFGCFQNGCAGGKGSCLNTSTAEIGRAHV